MKHKATLVLLLLLFGLALPVAGALSAPELQEEGDDDREVESRPPLAIPEGYRYDPAGRRDPFVNPVPPPAVPVEPAPAVPEVRPPGLPGVLLNEAQLLGVVTSIDRGMNMVVIQAPGNRTFIAEPGDELFDVVISAIRTDSVVFEVKPLEGAAEAAEREEVVRPVGAAPGE